MVASVVLSQFRFIGTHLYVRKLMQLLPKRLFKPVSFLKSNKFK